MLANEKIMEVIKGMEDAELVRIWNEYCYTANKYDDEIMDADQMEEWINNCDDKMNLLNRFFYGSDDFESSGSANPNRNYFCFNGYGNIVSFDYIYNEYSNKFYHMDADELVDYIIENEEAFYNDEIQEILDDMEDEEE